MPQKEIKANKWVLDPVTGYLTSLDPRHKFTALVKKQFLEELLQRRDIEEACEEVGISRRILTAHLRADAHFKSAYQGTIALVKDPERLRRLEAVDRLWKKASE